MTCQASELVYQNEDPVLLSSCLWAIFGTFYLEIGQIQWLSNALLLCRLFLFPEFEADVL